MASNVARGSVRPMGVHRLTALDAAFLAIEGPHAHMHVGWASAFDAPEDGPPPGFEAIFDHLAARFATAARWRQRLTEVPFGVHDAVWVDDPAYDPRAHILRSDATDLGALADEVMSVPLARDRPLWQLWVADGLAGGRIGLVGKAHHCMIDGVGAVELGRLLLDRRADGWREAREPEPVAAAPHPSRLDLLAGGVRDRVREQAGPPLSLVRHPASALRLPGATARVARTLGLAVLPPARTSSLNVDGSPERHLAMLARPLGELRQIRRRFSTTVNDVVLAACAGGLRTWALRRGETPRDLKAMVPVDVRASEDGVTGNRIAFVFVTLPVEEADPVVRLRATCAVMAARKQGGHFESGDAIVRSLGRLPRVLRRAMVDVVASPRMYNLAVSNIPGPRLATYLRGCRLRETYPVVPLADRHGLSIGMTTVGDRACFGLYADARTVPDADVLRDDVAAALDELAALVGAGPRGDAPAHRAVAAGRHD